MTDALQLSQTSLVRREFMYVIHHVMALVLLFGAMTHAEFFELRACSYVLLTEGSTLFMWIWEEYPSKSSLGAFLAAYMIFRPILFGRFLLRIFFSKDPLDPASKISIGFFHVVLLVLWILQVAWLIQFFLQGVPKWLRKLNDKKLNTKM